MELVPIEDIPEITYDKLALSHSQAEAFNQCEYKYKYAHMDNLEPNFRSYPLQKGTNGHAFFEAFFTQIKAGESEAVAKDVGMKAMFAENQGIALEVMPLVLKWVQDIWPKLDWTILIVEETWRVNLGDLGQMPYTMDLVVKDNKTGKILMVDHKFLGQNYSAEVIALMPQMPKYIAGLESTGKFKIDGAVYNMISTRSNAKELFYMYYFDVSDARKKNAMREHIITFRAVNELRSGERLPVRTINKMNCGHCGFRELCEAAINGNDKEEKFLMRTKFQANTYGYDYEIEA